MFRWLPLFLAMSNFLLAQVTGVPMSDEAGSRINLDVSRANPLLRNALSTNCPYQLRSGVSPENVEFIFREEWIDNQVDHFVKTIDTRLQRMRSLLTEAHSSRLELAASAEPGGNDAKTRWAASLRGLEEEARTIRSTMANAFPDMKLRDDLKISTRPQPEADLYQAEMDQLDQFVAAAESKIRDYLFKPTHVADLSELRGENLLTFLNRTERMARKLRTERFLKVPESRP